jgi:thiol-disulfide isomerase/thioredoxin
MKKGNSILLKFLGILLLAAAVMKGHQLLTEPAANADIWTNRAFMILTVEFELALGIWLLSGLFKRLAWLVVLGCFLLFSVITLYKGLSGFASCGCFGTVHINPWITLWVVDIPAVLALCIFRPIRCPDYSQAKPNGLLFQLKSLFTPLPSRTHFAAPVSIAVLILCITAPMLAFNEPAKVTSSYEVLEPSEWVDKPLAIIDYIDIGEKLKIGKWLILFYHHDCPDCGKALKQIELLYQEYGGNSAFRLGVVEVPPYGSPVKTKGLSGQLLDIKDWFVSTPLVILIENSRVVKVFQQKIPDWDLLFNKSTNNQFTALLSEGR